MMIAAYANQLSILFIFFLFWSAVSSKEKKLSTAKALMA